MRSGSAMYESDNVRDHRVRTMIMQAEKTARKPDFACIDKFSNSVLKMKRILHN